MNPIKSLKKLAIKLFAKVVSKKLGLYGGPMEDKKPWYKSKGVLGGLAAFLTGAYQLFSQTVGPAFGLVPIN